MQGSLFKIIAVAAFIALSLWYLFPTLQSRQYERDLAAMDDTTRARYTEENYDAITRSRERALNLGLDLQGGMHVTLEVGVGALLRELAGDRADEVFNEALRAATVEARTSQEPFVDLFVEAIEERQPGTRLSRYFRNAGAGITARSENAEVVAYLRAEATEALDRAVEIIRSRIDRFGVTEPNIQKQGASRIVAELPGVDDPTRVRELLRGTARLQFHLMAEPEDLQASAQRIAEYFRSGAAEPPPADTAEAAPAESTAVAEGPTDVADSAVAATSGDTARSVEELFDDGTADADEGDGDRFSQIVSTVQNGGVIFGAVAESDTSEANRLLARRQAQQLLPPGVTLMYTSDPEGETADGEPVFYLLGVRTRPELTGEVVTEAGPNFDPLTNQPEVTLSMNSEGSRRWSQITGANVGKQVAIVLDNVVYTYPQIINRITGGRTSITGVSRQEMEDVVTVLKSGALPAPVQIISERTVGPSLGAESTRAGAISFLVGLLTVSLFMILYYRTAGVVASVALVLNVLFIFGVLAAFGATLTLPGIAGMVLTLATAVDANVLIFERVREELDTGKTLRASLEGGFAKALSAIVDGNVTTFFTGVILYAFGVGPIQGFAVTLMAGIVTSLFSCLVVTRLILEYLVVNRRLNVAFG